MADTPNHDYNAPDEGAQNWHEPLNENFRQYDTDIEIRDADGNKGNYDPKDGAKFLATDTGTVYLGDGSNWQSAFDLGSNGVETLEKVGPTGNGNVRLRSPDGSISIDGNQSQSALEFSLAGEQTFSRLEPDGDFLGIGRSDQVTPSEAFGVRVPNDDNQYGGMYVDTPNSDGWPFYGYANSGTEEAWHLYDPDAEEWRLEFFGSLGVLSVDKQGNLTAQGNKNFVQAVDTDDGPKEVVYTASEAPTPRTEASGVAELDGGSAEIDLPDHFGWVTSDAESIHVQTTPYSVDSAGLAVVERSPERLVVEDVDGTGDYEFSYTVRGTRDGYEDKQVVREPRETRASGPAAGPASPDDPTDAPGDRIEGD